VAPVSPAPWLVQEAVCGRERAERPEPAREPTAVASPVEVREQEAIPAVVIMAVIASAMVCEAAVSNGEKLTFTVAFAGLPNGGLPSCHSKLSTTPGAVLGVIVRRLAWTPGVS
jgi:hypothetical protein